MNFTENEIVNYVDRTSAFIQIHRDVYYESASPLSSAEIEKFGPFFAPSILKNTRFYRKTDGVIRAPDFVVELQNRGVDFPWNGIRATTFIDIVVEYDELDTRTKFHELVHAVQYEKLGLKKFADKYIRGLLTTGSYMAIPLEINAYFLDKVYSSNLKRAFSVDVEVQQLIDADKF